jgi:D-threo-aldose 1-dehydrogenase
MEVGAVGFGCAGLYRIPDGSRRRATLRQAYELGFRHFDVAPMYGLGLAERELGSTLQRERASITITTKFGIGMRPLGSVARVLQKPLRSVAQGHQSVNTALKSSGSSPSTGLVGRVLYRHQQYTAEQARTCLAKSMRCLQTDYIDIFMLHEPPMEPGFLDPELILFLDREKEKGTIRTWGVAGDYPDDTPRLLDAFGNAPVLQIRDDALSSDKSPLFAPHRALITFGALGRPFAVLRQVISRNPESIKQWSDAAGIDVTAESSICRALVGMATLRNQLGPILVTTSNREHLEVLSSLAGAPTLAIDHRVIDTYQLILKSAQNVTG